jgi:hypothetical protein
VSFVVVYLQKILWIELLRVPFRSVTRFFPKDACSIELSALRKCILFFVWSVFCVAGAISARVVAQKYEWNWDRGPHGTICGLRPTRDE